MEINEDILIRYINGMLTEEEAAEVKNWRAASLENEKLLEQVYFTTQVASRLKVMRTVNPDEAFFIRLFVHTAGSRERAYASRTHESWGGFGVRFT